MEPELSSIKKSKQYRRPAERPFTAEERDNVTILVGGLTQNTRSSSGPFSRAADIAANSCLPRTRRHFSLARNSATTANAVPPISHPEL